MTLSELIREYVDLKIEGQPEDREWSSIDGNWQRREDYRTRLAEIEEQIDAIGAQHSQAAGGVVDHGI